MIEELLQCRCGHGISHHSGAGCEGDRMRPCSCVRTRADVLDRAISEVRTEFVSSPSPGTPVRYATPAER